MAEVAEEIQVQEIEDKAQEDYALIKSDVDTLVVDTQEKYTYANELLKNIKRQIKSIEAALTPGKKKAYEAYQAWLALIQKYTNPLKELERFIKGKIGGYLQEQERIRKEAEEKARKEAEERRLADAQVLAEQGQDQKADELLEKNIRVSKDVLPEKVDTGGSYTVTSYYVEIVGLMDLIKAVAKGEAASDYLLPNISELNRMAKQYKNELRIPGVKVIEKVDVRTRL